MAELGIDCKKEELDKECQECPKCGVSCELFKKKMLEHMEGDEINCM